jgi:predicted component of type VI protein secretion system
MPLNARQTDAVNSLLRRSAQLVADALNTAEAAADRPLVIRLNTLRRDTANLIADLDRGARQ